MNQHIVICFLIKLVLDTIFILWDYEISDYAKSYKEEVKQKLVIFYTSTSISIIAYIFITIIF